MTEKSHQDIAELSKAPLAVLIDGAAFYFVEATALAIIKMLMFIAI